ncbi:hypothetical protein DFH28DRAFT_583272 [Melampsora americana]|nr:hypothetical protein DFH28DRAFT_583272 [Melampsora americana]
MPNPDCKLPFLLFGIFLVNGAIVSGVDVDTKSHYTFLTSSTPTQTNLTKPVMTTNTTGSTGCFAYFNTKQGCASSDGHNNCPPKVTTGPVKQFGLNQISPSTTPVTDPKPKSASEFSASTLGNATVKSQFPVKSDQSNEVKESFLIRRKIPQGTIELKVAQNNSNSTDSISTTVSNSSDASLLNSKIEVSSNKSLNNPNVPLSSGPGFHSIAGAGSLSTPPLANLSNNKTSLSINNVSSGPSLPDSKTSLNSSNATLTSGSSLNPVAGVASLPTPPQANLSSNATTGSAIPPPISKPPTGGAPDASSSQDAICKPYDSETEIGICLWSGLDQTGNDRKQSGWISASAAENCGKEIIFARTGSTAKPIVGKLLDGCQLEATTLSAGCSQVFLTKKAFLALNPTAEEIASETLNGTLTWDFNSHNNTANMAV